MTSLTTELNLVLASDTDDTADYLDGATNSLKSSLQILDGLFNATTGHTHNGAHQGGALAFQNLNVGANLTVVGTSNLQGAVTMGAGLTITGAINSASTLSVGQDLSVGRDLSVTRNATISGTLTITGGLTAGAGLTITGNVGISGLLTVGRIVVAGVDYGAGFGIAVANGISQGFWYQRGNGAIRCWDNQDFTFGVTPAASTLVQRDGSGYINASYINYTGDTQGGRPTQILGRIAGDNYLRWWPANAIGPPNVARVWSGTCDSGGADLTLSGRMLNLTETADAANLATVSGTTITIAIAGYYHLYAMAQSSSQVFTDNRVWRLVFYVNGVAQTNKATSDTTPVNGNQSGGISRTHAVTGPVLLNVGDTVQVFGIHTASGWSVVAAAGGYVEMVFVPTTNNPN